MTTENTINSAMSMIGSDAKLLRSMLLQLFRDNWAAVSGETQPPSDAHLVAFTEFYVASRTAADSEFESKALTAKKTLNKTVRASIIGKTHLSETAAQYTLFKNAGVLNGAEKIQKPTASATPPIAPRADEGQPGPELPPENAEADAEIEGNAATPPAPPHFNAAGENKGQATNGHDKTAEDPADKPEAKPEAQTQQEQDKPAPRKPEDIFAYDWKKIGSIFPPYAGSTASNGLNAPNIGRLRGWRPINFNTMRMIAVYYGGPERDPQFLATMAAQAAHFNMSVDDMIAQTGGPMREPARDREGNIVTKDGETVMRDVPYQEVVMRAMSHSALMQRMQEGNPAQIVAMRLDRKKPVAFRNLQAPTTESKQLLEGANLSYHDKLNNLYTDNGHGVKVSLGFGQKFNGPVGRNQAAIHVSNRLDWPSSTENDEIVFRFKTGKNVLSKMRGKNGEHAYQRDIMILAALEACENVGKTAKMYTDAVGHYKELREIDLRKMSPDAVNEMRADGVDVDRLVAIHNAKFAGKDGPEIKGDPAIAGNGGPDGNTGGQPQRAPESQDGPALNLAVLAAKPYEQLILRAGGDFMQDHLKQAREVQAMLMATSDLLREKGVNESDIKRMTEQAVKNDGSQTTELVEKMHSLYAQDVIQTEIAKRTPLHLNRNSDALPAPYDASIPSLETILANGETPEAKDKFKALRDNMRLAQAGARLADIALNPAAATPHDVMHTDAGDTMQLKMATAFHTEIKQDQAQKTLTPEKIDAAQKMAESALRSASEGLTKAGFTDAATKIAAASASTVAQKPAAEPAKPIIVPQGVPTAPKKDAGNANGAHLNGKDNAAKTEPALHV